MRSSHNTGGTPGVPSKAWFPYWRARPGARIRLICFPFAGGSASVLHRWLEPAPSVEVLAVQYPGRESRFTEPPCHRVDTLVTALEPVVRPLLDRPFAFLGYSLGTLVSLELAYRLRRAGGPAPLGMILAAGLAPHLQRRRIMHSLPEAAFFTELQRYGGTSQVVLENRELMELMLPVLRADFEMAETYSPAAEPPLSVPLCVWGGAEDAQPVPQELDAWRGLTTGEVQVEVFPGGHFFYQGAPDAIRARVESTLGRWADKGA